ncbi:hypothetical protein COLO4_04157 [Corchorus olitorius]|uniref:Uncharacterized protein n=1 Tax=Corchorus olitorius TaxID=93759 RepID=A0A1R3KUZ2_9ROSI|nr:hypothetical protein COLO4_04157 [Corchorus olitorius]
MTSVQGEIQFKLPLNLHNWCRIMAMVAVRGSRGVEGRPLFKCQSAGSLLGLLADKTSVTSRCCRDATADMSENLSEGERGNSPSDVSAHSDSVNGRMPRISFCRYDGELG